MMKLAETSPSRVGINRLIAALKACIWEGLCIHSKAPLLQQTRNLGGQDLLMRLILGRQVISLQVCLGSRERNLTP